MEFFPSMPLDAWADSKETLHRFVPVVGKIRLAAGARRNHWWRTMSPSTVEATPPSSSGHR
jgi:uncharacterized protein DUF5996